MVLGTQHLPDPLQAGGRPLLFVGNHTRFGLYDLPLLVRSILIMLQQPSQSARCKWRDLLESRLASDL